MALGNCSRVRRICAMALMAGIDHWLCRRACSYEPIAPSKSPISSDKLPDVGQQTERHSQLQTKRGPTNLQPHLLIESSDLLRSGHRWALGRLRLHRLHRQMTVHRRRMAGHMAMRRRHASGGGWLRMRHDSISSLPRGCVLRIDRLVDGGRRVALASERGFAHGQVFEENRFPVRSGEKEGGWNGTRD